MALHYAIAAASPYKYMGVSLLKAKRARARSGKPGGTNILGIRDRMTDHTDRDIVLTAADHQFSGGAFDLTHGPVKFYAVVPAKSCGGGAHAG